MLPRRMNLLETARLEIEGLKRQREALIAAFDARIDAVEQAIKILDLVYGPTDGNPVPVLDESVGITEAIETALRKWPGKLLPPTSVRDALSEMGFRVAGNNPMASVHQVLKRLVARAGSPYVYEQIDGQTQYKFDPSREATKARLVVPQTSRPIPSFDISIVEKALNEALRVDADRMADLSKRSAIKAITEMQQRNKK
jgi:hypothetical protein